MDIAYVTIENVMDAAIGREFALNRYVVRNPKINEEFIMSLEKSLYDMNSGELMVELHKFIERKGFTVIDEKPSIRLDTNNNWYRVDVTYTIKV